MLFDKLCATSSGMANELSRRTGREVDILWNFPETEIILEHQKNIKKHRPNKIKIMYMGNVSGNQNIVQILKAFENIGIQRKFELHIFCHGAREIDQVKKANVNMPSTIHFHGSLRIKELANVSYNYDYGIVSLGNHPNLHNILPSRVQSFCAMRMPLISFGCPELAVLIKKYKFGFFVNEYSAADLILTLDELYETYSVDKREQMAINSIELTRSIFSIDRACRIICE
jgi:glycosyltransferase involved in cell wall biosynthesis